MQIIKAFWKTIGWALFVLLLSALSGEKVEKIIILIHLPNIDKFIHFSMYFIFTFLMIYDFNHLKKKTITLKQAIIFSVAVAIAYGGIMELLQSIPRLHRTTDIFDFLANAAGSLTAVLLYRPISSMLDRFTALIIKPPRDYFL